MQRIIRLPRVKDATGLSRSTIYKKISGGDFPPPISLGDRAVGWLESDIERWLTSRVEKTRPTRPPSPAEIGEGRQP